MDYILVVAKKLAYFGLILWLGILAPITYFNVFAADHMVQPYKVAVFETMPQKRQLPAELLSQQNVIRLKQSLTDQKDLITARTPFTSFSQSLQTTLSQIIFSSGVAMLLLAFYCGPFKRKYYLPEDGNFIAPPKKPPRFLPVMS